MIMVFLIENWLFRTKIIQYNRAFLKLSFQIWVPNGGQNLQLLNCLRFSASSSYNFNEKYLTPVKTYLLCSHGQIYSQSSIDTSS